MPDEDRSDTMFPKPSGPIRLTLFALVALISFGIGQWALSPLTAVRIVKHFGYWMLLFTVCSTSLVILQTLLPEIRAGAHRFRKRNLLSLGLICLGTIFIQTRETDGFKIIDDEIAILATSRQMHYEREIAVPTRAHNIIGVLDIMDADTFREEMEEPERAGGAHVDKRQPLFPFMVSLVHDFTGYRAENPFHLNFLLTPVLLLLLFLLGRRYGGDTGGDMALIFAISTPLLSQSSNGGGPEILNLCFITGTIILGIRALEEPSNRRLSALALTGVLLAQTRYESVVFTIAIGLVYAFAWMRSGRIVTPAGLFAAPVLLIPYLWVSKAFQVYPGFWQLASTNAGSSPFSTDYALGNLQRFTRHFFDLSINQPNNFMLTVVGLAALPIFLYSIFRRCKGIRSADSATVALFTFLPAFAILFVVMLCYAYSLVDDPIAHRLALPFIIPLIAISIAVVHKAAVHRHVWTAVLITAAIYFFAFTVPCASRHVYTDKLVPAQEVAWSREFIRKNSRQDYLMIATTSFLWIAHGVESITIGRANDYAQKVQFQIDQQPGKHFYVLQKMDYNPLTGNEKPVDPVPLSSEFTLEKVDERFFTLYDFVRISRINGVRVKNSDGIKIPPTDLDAARNAQQNLQFWIEHLP